MGVILEKPIHPDDVSPIGDASLNFPAPRAHEPMNWIRRPGFEEKLHGTSRNIDRPSAIPFACGGGVAAHAAGRVDRVVHVLCPIPAASCTRKRSALDDRSC